MKRSRLRNKNLIIMNEIENFIPNKELIASLCLKKTKKAYLDEGKVSDNKTFLENDKAFTIQKIQCQRKDRFK